MNVLVLFTISALTFGVRPEPDATMYHWIIDYTDVTVEDPEFTTTIPEVNFDPLDGRSFNVKVRYFNGVGWSAFSEPSYQAIVNPLDGDANFDGIVDLVDHNLVRQRFGDTLP